MYVVWENVPGLLSANNGRDFASVLVALGNIGYYGAWTMLDAQFFGLAQRRRRGSVFFARGNSGARASARTLIFRRGACRGYLLSGGRCGATVAYALAAGAGGSKFGSRRRGQDTCIAKPLGAHHGRLDWTMTPTFLNPALPAMGAAHRPDRPAIEGAEREHGKGDVVLLVAFAWQQGVSPNDRLYPVRAGNYAGSVSASRVDAGNHPSGRLAPKDVNRERERSEGSPADGWTASQSDSARYRMLGNAVAVPVVKWIAHRIAKVQR